MFSNSGNRIMACAQIFTWMILYTHLTSARLGIADRLALRITPPSMLNDPFECMAMPDCQKKILEIWENETKALYREKTGRGPAGPSFTLFRKQCLLGKQEWVESCRSNPDDRLNPSAGEKIQNFVSHHLGVLCFSERPDNSLMWSHYAENYSGFVLGFDSLHPIFRRVESEAKSCPKAARQTVN